MTVLLYGNTIVPRQIQVHMRWKLSIKRRNNDHFRLILPLFYTIFTPILPLFYDFLIILELKTNKKPHFLSKNGVFLAYLSVFHLF
jgi:hypothetical protein